MIDEQRSKDFKFSYDTNTGSLTLRFYHPEECRNVEIELFDTAVTTCLELLVRNQAAVREHITPRLEQEVRQV